MTHEEYALWRAQQPAFICEQLGVRQRVNDRFAQTRDDVVQAADTLERNIDGRRRDDLPCDSLLVLV